MEIKHKFVCLAWILSILCFLAIYYIHQENERQIRELRESYWGLGHWIYDLEISRMNFNHAILVLGIFTAAKYVIDGIILKM